MAFKPRTMRRIILIGSVFSVVLLGLVGYFVVRPMQTKRSLEAKRVEGLAAYEAEDYLTTTKMLRQYLNREDNPDPQIILMYARARAKVQTSDGGYLRVASQSYSRYLRINPGDVVASKELLPIFNDQAMYFEAAELGQTIRTKLNDNSLLVLREEVLARRQLDERDESIGNLFDLALQDNDADFEDIYNFIEWTREIEGYQAAKAQAGQWIEGHQEMLAAQVADIWLRIIEEGEGLSNSSTPYELYAEELARTFGLNATDATWISEPSGFTAELTDFAAHLFNGLRRSDLSLALREKSSELLQDHSSLIWTARRLYWTGEYEKLSTMPVLNDNGEPVPDVIGYQKLANAQLQNDGLEQLQGSEINLSDVTLDYRARAWSTFLEGIRLKNDGQVIAARGKILNSLEKYPNEPTFLLYAGDIHSEQGRIKDAIQSWDRANEAVLTDAGQIGWFEPSLRSLNLYMGNGRFTEARAVIDQLSEQQAHQNLFGVILNVYAELVRVDAIDTAEVRRLIPQLDQIVNTLSTSELSPVSPAVVTLYAASNQHDQATQVLSEQLQAEVDQGLMVRLVEIDQFYGLGVAENLGIQLSTLGGMTPQVALRLAINNANAKSVDDGLQLIQRYEDAASQDEVFDWQLARAQFLDLYSDSRARAVWDDLRQQQPANIELLYRVAESNAYEQDPDAIQEIIDLIVQETFTVGKVIPSRLRLAHANAIIEQRLTRSTRDAAIEQVRSVVASEQQNIQARNMLARLLSLLSPPHLSESERFEPNYVEAIEQYIVISRQLEGSSAQPYLLEAIDLASEIGDRTTAIQYLREFEERFETDLYAMASVADRYMVLNELEVAYTIFERLYNEQHTDREMQVDAGLRMLNLAVVLDRRSDTQRLLSELKEVDNFSVDQLVDLASLHTKSGFQPEGDDLALSGSRYGLDEYDSRLVYALYAAAYVSAEAHVQALEELTQIDPGRVEPWKMLLQYALKENNTELAGDIITRAKVQLDDFSELESLALLAEGKLQSVADLLTNNSSDTPDPYLIEAARRMDEFIAAIDIEPREKLIDMLIGMYNDFPAFEPMQVAVLQELQSLRFDAAEFATLATRSARAFPKSGRLLEMAGESLLRTGDSAEAIEFAALWRSSSSQNPVFADALSARAYIQLERFGDAVRTVQPYILGAFDEPELPINLELLRIHSHASLMSGENPSVTAQRLIPLLAKYEQVRKSVWLNLILTSMPSQQVASEWLDEIQPYLIEDEQILHATTWVLMLEQFNEPTVSDAQETLDRIKNHISEDTDDADLIAFTARAHAMLGQALNLQSDHDSAIMSYQSAFELLKIADMKNPSNLAYLAQGSYYASIAGIHEECELMCREILSRVQGESPFVASVRNNLAMSIERQNPGAERLAEALQLINQSISYSRNPSYYGTQGWVLIALERYSEAESAFRTLISSQNESLEGHVGLAISLNLSGEDRADEALAVFERIRELDAKEPLTDELLRRLEKQGQPVWASVFSD